jgi:hypothetical protein
VSTFLGKEVTYDTFHRTPTIEIHIGIVVSTNSTILFTLKASKPILLIMNNNYLQSLLNKIKASRDNLGLGELQKELKPWEILFEMFEYEEPETGSFGDRLPSVDKRVKGPVILDSPPSGNAVNMWKSVWNSEDKKPKFVVLEGPIFSKKLMAFLQQQTSLGALFLINRQTDAECNVDLSNNTSLKELYVLSDEGVEGGTFLQPSQLEIFNVYLRGEGLTQYTISSNPAQIKALVASLVEQGEIEYTISSNPVEMGSDELLHLTIKL